MFTIGPATRMVSASTLPIAAGASKARVSLRVAEITIESSGTT